MKMPRELEKRELITESSSLPEAAWVKMVQEEMVMGRHDMTMRPSRRYLSSRFPSISSLTMPNVMADCTRKVITSDTMRGREREMPITMKIQENP